MRRYFGPSSEAKHRLAQREHWQRGDDAVDAVEYAPVARDQVVARIYPTGRTGSPPSEIRAKMDGILCARHFPGLVKAGDCVAVLAVTV